MAEKKHVSESFPLVSSLVRAGIDPLKVLTDAGFEIPAEKLRLSQQLRITPPISKNNPKSDGTERKPENEKTPERKLIDQKYAAFKKTETWLEKMVKGQPAIVVKAALIWLGQDYCRKKRKGPDWEPPEWVIFHVREFGFDHGDIVTKINYSNMQDKLLSCLNDYPERTIKSLSILSQVYEIAFGQSNYYATPKRLEKFFRRNFLSWRGFAASSDALVKLIEAAERLYLDGKPEHKTKMFSLLFKFLEFYFIARDSELKTIESILYGWRKIGCMDVSFFKGYKSVHALNMAATKACGVSVIKGKMEILEAVDEVTRFEYLNLSARKDLFKKIGQLYTTHRSPNEVKSVVCCFTLSEDERNILDQLCKGWNISKIEAINQSVGHAYKYKIRKRKKDLEKNAGPLFNRANIKNVPIRTSPKASQQLIEVTSALDGLKATKGKSVSKSAALGWALKIYAADLDLDLD